jgi:hypothetical protein
MRNSYFYFDVQADMFLGADFPVITVNIVIDFV